jgi:hypothetical protein
MGHNYLDGQLGMKKGDEKEKTILAPCKTRIGDCKPNFPADIPSPLRDLMEYLISNAIKPYHPTWIPKYNYILSLMLFIKFP